MAKKSQWKKAIRAEVAAALQGSTPNQLPQSEPTERTSGEGLRLPSAQEKTPGIVDQTLVRQDLKRIGVVAGGLLILLVAATVTDHRWGWLDRAAVTLSDRLQPAVTPPLRDSIDASAPAEDQPTKALQSAAGASE